MSEAETKTCSAHHIRMHKPECSRCRGEGEIADDDGLMSFRPNMVRCWSCHGSGSAPGWECELCLEEWQEQEDEYWRKQERACDVTAKGDKNG